MVISNMNSDSSIVLALFRLIATVFASVIFFSDALAAVDAGAWPVRTNQVGFEPNAPKFCTASNPPLSTFVLQRAGEDVRWHTVYEGRWLDAPSGRKGFGGQTLKRFVI